MKRYWLVEDWGADGWQVFYDSDDLKFIKQKMEDEGREKTAFIVEVVYRPY